MSEKADKPAAASRPRRSDALPANLPPRGLNRLEAAAYIGISATKFDELIRAGSMPAPKRIDGRVVWDRFRIDSAFEALPDGHGRDDDPWGSAAV